MKFDPNLLSMPNWGFSAQQLRQIGDILLKKILSAKLRKFPNRVKLLVSKYKQFMELYEQTAAT